MQLKIPTLAPRYQHILETCRPFLVTARSNLSALDLAPFGVEILPEDIHDPTQLRSRRVIDGLHAMDAFSFGDQSMLMPRWVLFDCGEFPGIVFGFGRQARDLPEDVRRAYGVLDEDQGACFLPLSMWIAIRCAEEGAWFGHNLASANLVAKQTPLSGLATLTKAFGIAVTRSSRQYGATQWSSASLNIHLNMGEMELLSAYTPAHTHPETFVYKIDVDLARVAAALKPAWSRPSKGGLRFIDADDADAIHALHSELEGGARLRLLRVERRPGASNRLWLEPETQPQGA